MTAILTPEVVNYALSEEAIGLSAYLDGDIPPVWTWAGGIAATSGANVEQYKDNPQPIEVCLNATIQMMHEVFLPPIERDFAGIALADHQLAAVISFNWRNGPNTTRHAQWVQAFKAGKPATAAQLWMEWTSHGTEVQRATRERDLFFNSAWPVSQLVRVFTATGPRYLPVGGTMTNVLPILQTLLGGQ